MEAEKTVTLPLARVNALLKAESQLAALHAAGVDNWEGYDAAFAQGYEFSPMQAPAVDETATQVVIKVPNQQLATMFLTWLSESGEQDFWLFMESQDDVVETRFEYHSPLDLNYPSSDRRRYANATFCPGNVCTMQLV